MKLLVILLFVYLFLKNRDLEKDVSELSNRFDLLEDKMEDFKNYAESEEG